MRGGRIRLYRSLQPAPDGSRMKIRKRRQPLDFGALAEGTSADFEETEALEVAPDFDLSPAEPPSGAIGDGLFEPIEPPLAGDAPVKTRGGSPAKPTSTKAAVPLRRPDSPQATTPLRGATTEPDPREPSQPKLAEPAQAAPRTSPERPAEAPPAMAPLDLGAESSASASETAPQQPKPEPDPLRTVSGRPSTPSSARSRQTTAAPLRTAAPPRATAPSVRSGSSGRRREAPAPWPLYAGAAAVTVGWAGGLAALAWTYRGGEALALDPLMLAALAALVIGPAALIWIAAYLAHQGRVLAAEASRAKSLADEMISPAVIAAGRTGDLVQAIRAEIAQAGQTAKDAHETLISLREALAAETARLAEATGESVRTASGLAESLGRERAEMTSLSQALEAQSAAVVEAIGRQTRVVGEASDLAETQLREAEASLTARAADLTTAVGAAGDSARAASEDLTRHIARLETAGGGVAEQISVVESGLVEQRAALVTASQALRADQEVFAAEAESQTAKLSEFIGQARQAAAEMGERAIKGADALRDLIAEAADQFREFSDQAKIERDAFGASTKDSLEAVAATAAQEREKLEGQTRAAIEALVKASEETRQAAERHADAARAQVDQLSEAAFTAGQRANQVFEARLSEARDLIERSAQMVEQAGSATAKKLDEGASAARGALEDLERLLGEIEERAMKFPAAARQQAEEVRKAVTEGMDELMEHARRTAEETEAIDLAFQERVRRNYEMLSEAVRLMGTVASTAAPPPREARAPQSRAAPPEPPAEAAKPAHKPETEAAQRPRLRLTPTATDEEFSSVFEAAAGRPGDPAEDAEGWTWKELLSSIDDDAEVPDARIEATLVAEIAGMGIDPAALLPRGRIDEIVDLLKSGESDGRRSLVRRLAPAATRRLARRLFTDPALRQQVRRYVARYEKLLEAGAREGAGQDAAALLATDSGRAFLLLDAAVGDAG